VLPLGGGDPAAFGVKSKLEVPGKGGVGGKPFLGLPANESLSGVGGCPCDPAEILLD